MGMMDKVSTTRMGTPDSAGTVYLPLQLALSTDVFGYSINPRLYVTPVKADSKGGGAKESFYALYLPVSFSGYLSDWSYSLGLGIISFNIDGEGGIVALNNGTGTSNFARPGRSTSSRLWFMGAGLSDTYFDSFRGDLDLFVMTPGSDDKRSFNLSVAISYIF